MWQMVKVIHICKKRPIRQMYRFEKSRDKVEDYIEKLRYGKYVDRDTSVYIYICVCEKRPAKEMYMGLAIRSKTIMRSSGMANVESHIYM